MTSYKLLNVEAQLSLIQKGLKTRPIQYPVIDRLVQDLATCIGQHVERRNASINPIQLSILQRISEDLRTAREHIRRQDSQNTQQTLILLIQKYRAYSSCNSAYLVRHPEKMETDLAGPESSAGRELSPEGVRQAKAFAEIIEEEILMSSLPVQVKLLYSNYHRTKLFAELIKLKINAINPMYGKNVTLTFQEDEYISGGLIKNDDPAHGAWTAWAATPNGKIVNDSVKHWFIDKESSDPSKTTISIGTTHFPIIFSFLINTLHIPGDRAETFKYADYIKHTLGRYYYEQTWL
jgi:hypothetical protein